jgi:glycosyltransferase involved in cell wall biosynthesis
MDIAIVSMQTDLHGPTAGRGRTRRFAEQFTTGGHSVQVLCAKWWRGEIPGFRFNEVRYEAVTERLTPLRFALFLPLALLRMRPDVIHVVNDPPLAVVAARVAATLLRVPLIVDWWSPGLPETRWSQLAARVGDVTLVASDLLRTDLQRHGGQPESTLELPESVDVATADAADPVGAYDIITAGRLDDASNVDGFLTALGQLRQEEWEAAVIGDGPARSHAEKIAADLRITDRVTFLGDLDRATHLGVCKGAHVFVHTREDAPFATELLRALVCGCVGVVEYQEHSSAHELVELYDRGFTVTDAAELPGIIEEARELPHQVFDDGFVQYGHGAVLQQLESIYTTPTR